MRIESPLEGYGELFEAVRARRPDLLESDSPSFPVILRRRFGWTAWSVGLIAAGVVLCRYFATPLWSDASWNFTFVYRATFGVASFSLGAWMFCMSETKIVFTKNAIERHTPFFREALPVYRIVDVERSRDEHPEQGASQLLCLTWLSAQSHSEARAHVLVLDSMRLSGDLEAVEQLLADNYVWLDDDRLPDAA